MLPWLDQHFLLIQKHHLVYQLLFLYPRFHSKKLVHGIEIGKESFAITKQYAKVNPSFIIETEMGTITVKYDKEIGTISVTDSQNNHIKSLDIYWFAWYAFHPDTKVIE